MANNTKVNTVATPFKNPKGGTNVPHGSFGHKPLPLKPAPGVPMKGCC